MIYFPIRMERLWRDVYNRVLDLFYTFTNLEGEDLLNPENKIHLCALHWCFVLHVQKHLQVIQDGWTCEGNQPH